MNIWIAAADNDLNSVKQFIAQGTGPNAKDDNGYTAMHAAASYGHIDLLKYLVENGGDVNITDNDGDTPLHSCEAVLSARTLVQLGADPNRKNDEGQSPLDKAVEEQEFPDLINYFMVLLGKAVPQAEDMQVKVNFQDEPTEETQDRRLNQEQREQLESIINGGTDAQLEEFLSQAMANGPGSAGSAGPAGSAGSDSTPTKRTKH